MSTEATTEATPTQQSVVIVGGGVGGVRTAEHLRDGGHTGSITIFAAEKHLPYHRPGLSKAYLTGDAEASEGVVHDQAWYDDHDIDLRLGTAVTAVETDVHQVVSSDGKRTPYDTLVLATGSSARGLDLPGADLGGVVSLRTIDDMEVLKAALADAERVVVIGAGWIGLEVASAARNADCEVTVLESASAPLVTIVGEEVAGYFAKLHRDHGVDLRTGVSVASIEAAEGSHKVGAVRLEDGTEIPTDLVVVGVGAAPNLDLATRAGLAIDDETGGVVVDAQGRTSDPDVFAVGDIASEETPALGAGARVRVEHWANANDRPKATARGILGAEGGFDKLPFFYSDQYDMGVEYAGHASGEDELVLRGTLESGEFIAFWLEGDAVRAGMNVNVWEVTEHIQDLVTSGKAVDRAKLADADVPLGDVYA